MRTKKILAWMSAAIVVLMVVSTFGGVVGDNTSGTEERVIVVFKDKIDESLVKDKGWKIDHKYTIIPAVVTHLKSKDIESLKANSNIKDIELDGIMSIIGKPSWVKPPKDDEEPPQVVDWGVDRIDADLIWDVTTGNEVKVAIIDTGIDKDHPDLQANIKGGQNFVAKNWRVSPKLDAWDDDNGHGTHCAGVVAAVDNTEGVIGVAPAAHLYGVKVLNKRGSGYISDIIKGIEWATYNADNNNGVDVISMSFGGTGDYQSMSDACDAAYAEGIVLVAAAGNDGIEPPLYPARYSSVIAVSATDNNNDVVSWSNFGNEIDLAAPGVSIYSTYKGGDYETMSGTSMACPHVAGTVALILEDYDKSPLEVYSILTTNAWDVDQDGWDVYYGYGMVDAEGAYDSLEP